MGPYLRDIRPRTVRCWRLVGPYAAISDTISPSSSGTCRRHLPGKPLDVLT